MTSQLYDMPSIYCLCFNIPNRILKFMGKAQNSFLLVVRKIKSHIWNQSFLSSGCKKNKFSTATIKMESR